MQAFLHGLRVDRFSANCVRVELYPPKIFQRGVCFVMFAPSTSPRFAPSRPSIYRLALKRLGFKRGRRSGPLRRATSCFVASLPSYANCAWRAARTECCLPSVSTLSPRVPLFQFPVRIRDSSNAQNVLTRCSFLFAQALGSSLSPF